MSVSYQQLKQSLWSALPKQLQGQIQPSDIQISRPNNNMGDLASNVALLNYRLVSEQFTSSLDLAQVTVDQFNRQQSKIIASVAAPGFINLELSEAFFSQLWQELRQRGQQLVTKSKHSQKIVIDYSSPNIAKPFTIGHLRSTIIGDAIANLYEAVGYQVFRDNHLGDWGTQFGKQIAAIKKWGDEEQIANSPNPVKELVALYVKFHQEAEKDPQLLDEGRAWFKKLEDGDPEARRVWQRCIDWSFVEFNRIYQRLGVKFTENEGRGFGESYFEPYLKEVIKIIQDSGLLKTGKDGAQLIFYPNDQYPPLMIVKADGATLYATRDLATDHFRLNNPRYLGAQGEKPIIINEVGAEQSLYFKQLYQAEEMLNWVKPGQRIHVKHGLYRFADGKMSTRKGKVIWLDEVLNRAHQEALQLSDDQESAWALAIAALKWNDLKRNSELNINFDWQEIINLQGNSGPYMLYVYARAKSVLRKAAAAGIDDYQHMEFTTLSEQEKDLMQLLSEFESVVINAQQQLAPHQLCNYLFELAQSFNSFYQKVPILTKDTRDEALLSRNFRLQLTEQLALTIKFGLKLLGISTVERL